VESGADEYGVSVKSFEHPWAQSSIIVTIPGKTNSTVILGAHQDSINYTNPMTMRAPGLTTMEVGQSLFSKSSVRF
jgi:leucyl aminopeptidase